MGDKYRIIELTQGYVAIISAKDYRRVNKHSWRVHFSAGSKRKHGQPYARSTINGKEVYLHRFIMNDSIEYCTTEGCTEQPHLWHVDHKNKQTLDCRRQNLEVCFYLENIARRRPRL